MLSLRPITPEDDSFLARVYASSRAEELAITGWTEQLKADFCRSQFDAQTAYYARELSGGVLSNRSNATAGRSDGSTSRAGKRKFGSSTSRCCRNHAAPGIGTKLLLELQEEARAAGKSLTIHVERFNRALALYQRLGFKEIEDKGVYLLMRWNARP